MRRVALGLLVFLLFIPAAAAQDGQIVWVESLELEAKPITKRVVYIIDVSGSMKGPPIAKASTVALQIMSRPVDEAYAKVYVFNDSCWRLGEGWWRLPDRELIDRVAERDFLELQAVGNTGLGSAVKTAILETVEDDATFVLLSDGDVTGPTEVHLSIIAKAQAERKKAGRFPAVIHAITIRELAAQRGTGSALEFMTRIARDNGGSCVLMEQRLVH